TSPFGPLVETDPARLEATLAVNTRVPLLLTRALGPQLLARGRGGLVFMSSLIAMHGAPGFAAYAATRGFTLALGESLWAELRGSGLDVLVACPGAVDTEGFRDLRPNRGALRWTPVASPTAVAEEILEALGGGGPTRVVGLSSRLAERAFSLLPRGAASRLVASRVRRLYRR
ncbi:MAG: SDR family NAD(P)-dependent oxidoreductase, partial [Myxococcota bacterium]